MKLGNTGWSWFCFSFHRKINKKPTKTSHKKHLCSFYTMVNLKMLLRNCVFIYISFFFDDSRLFFSTGDKQLRLDLFYFVMWKRASPYEKEDFNSTYVSSFNSAPKENLSHNHQSFKCNHKKQSKRETSSA
jgi:hypothetical protein